MELPQRPHLESEVEKKLFLISGFDDFRKLAVKSLSRSFEDLFICS